MKPFINPRTGKPVPGAFVCSHAELECHHYEALKDPAYRQELWNIWHEVEHEPSLASLYSEPTASIPPVELPPPLNGFDKLQGQMVELRDSLQKHLKQTKIKSVSSGKL